MVLSIVLTLACLASPAPVAALERLRFLIGEWEADSGGKAGGPTGGFTFAPAVQGRVIVRTSHADYPPAGGKPASRHDDLMVLYANEAGEIRADYYDSEGHVIRYAALNGPAGELTLVSEAQAGGPRFRLTYALNPDGALAGRFEIAPPGTPAAFGPYLAWTARPRGSAR